MEIRIRKLRRYERCDSSVKGAILHELETSGLSIKMIAERYGIEPNTVRTWLHQMRQSQEKELFLPGEIRHQEESPEDNAMAAKKKVVDEMTEHELRNRIAELEKSLDYANLRNEALELMIDIAERQEGIRIRKKSGAKRS